MPMWMRCKAVMTLNTRGVDRAEYLWPGLVINLERELAPGFTVGDAIAGRESEFEPVDDPAAEDDPAAPTMTEAPVTRLED